MKRDLGACWVAVEGLVWVGEYSMGVLEDGFEEVVLDVAACEGVAVCALYGERLS